MPPAPLFSLSARDCELLNHSFVPYEELRFLRPDSTASSPKCFTIGETPKPVYARGDCAIYPAIFNRLPVMVKEVGLDDDLLHYFQTDRKYSLSQYRQLREIIVGVSLPRHGNLCQVLAWTRSPKQNHLMMVTERFDDDLAHYLAQCEKTMSLIPKRASPAEGGVLGWEQFFLVATELASALEKLGKLNRGWSFDGKTTTVRDAFVAHRDLKLANLFLVFHDNMQQISSTETQIPRIKTVAVGDFGLARIEDCKVLPMIVTQDIGTLSYQPPEVLDPETFTAEDQLTPKLDIFSYGVILWWLLHYPTDLATECKNKYKDVYKTNPLFQVAIVEGKVELPIDPSLPEDLKLILLSCCKRMPSERPSAKEVRKALLATTKCREFFRDSDVVRTVTNASSGSLRPFTHAAAPEQTIEPATRNLLTSAEQEGAKPPAQISGAQTIDPSSVLRQP